MESDPQVTQLPTQEGSVQPFPPSGILSLSEIQFEQTDEVPSLLAEQTAHSSVQLGSVQPFAPSGTRELSQAEQTESVPAILASQDPDLQSPVQVGLVQPAPSGT